MAPPLAFNIKLSFVAYVQNYLYHQWSPFLLLAYYLFIIVILLEDFLFANHSFENLLNFAYFGSSKRFFDSM